MKIPYNLLMTQKEPIIYVEHARIRMKDGILVAISDQGRYQISPANHILMILGSGTSISQEAVIFACQHNMHFAVGRGGSYIHSYWMSGRWAEPHKIVFQSKVHSTPELRLKYSKELLKYRFIKECANDEYLHKLDAITDVNQVLPLEASWARDVYKIERIANDIDFIRDKNARQGINSRLTLLNNALYSFTTAVILNYGLHPSIGLLHGQTRRGGFSFDLADIFKYDLSIYNSFKYRECEFKYCLMKFSQALKEDNYKAIKEMIEICSWMSGEKENLC